MITELLIKNFKSIGEDLPKLELKPLTIFVGKNSTGKSNIIETLAILAQTTRLERNIIRSLEGSLSHGKFVQYPRLHDLSPFNLIAHKKDLQKHITIEIHIKDKKSQKIGYLYSYIPQKKETYQSVFKDENKIIELGYLNTGPSSWRRVFLYPEDIRSLAPFGETEYILNTDGFRFVGEDEKILNSKNSENVFPVAKKIVEEISEELEHFYFTSALRGDIEPVIEISSIEEAELGKHGEGLIEILSLIFRRSEYEGISEKIIKWSDKFGLSNIKAGWWGGKFLSSDFVDPDLHTRLNTAVASYGSKQILTIITQLFWTPPGSIIAIEEPEISLHPEAQIFMQEMFAEAIKEGKQIIITTHSSFLLLALSDVVKKGLIAPDDIAIYHIEKGEGGTTANPQKSLELDKNGYITGWVPSFVRVEDQLFKEWAEKIE